MINWDKVTCEDIAMQAGRGSDQFVVRMPEGMKEKIVEAASKNRRSINSEILHRLENFMMIDRHDEPNPE